MSARELKYVLREMGPTAREFYRRLGDGELATACCEACDELHFPPRSRCPGCGAVATWRRLSGRGKLYAYTQQERGLRFTAPDVIGIVELDEGVRVFGKIEAPFDRLEVGLSVEADLLKDESGMTLLAFRACH